MAHYNLGYQPTYKEDLSKLNKDNSGDFIRLLRVIHIDKTSVTCDLQVFPLKDAPFYAALSYCWDNGE